MRSFCQQTKNRFSYCRAHVGTDFAHKQIVEMEQGELHELY